MADIPESIGHMSLTGQLGLLISDTADVGQRPEERPMLGTATITPTLDRPIAAVAEKMVFMVASVTCDLDADGRIVPPNDGENSTSGSQDGDYTVDLVAPNQGALSTVGWSYTVALKPAKGQTWKPFTVTGIGFDSKPGDIIDISAAVANGQVATLSSQPFVWIQEGTALPEGIKPGQFLLDTLTNSLYYYA